MLDVFLRLASRLRADLGSQGFWANAIDPRTGTALFDTEGGAWSEVTAARTLLKYPTRDTAACPVIMHPVHGAEQFDPFCSLETAYDSANASLTIFTTLSAPYIVSITVAQTSGHSGRWVARACRHQLLPRNCLHRRPLWHTYEGGVSGQQHAQEWLRTTLRRC